MASTCRPPNTKRHSWARPTARTTFVGRSPWPSKRSLRCEVSLPGSVYALRFSRSSVSNSPFQHLRNGYKLVAFRFVATNKVIGGGNGLGAVGSHGFVATVM